MMLDIFKNDAFALTELVASINKIPYVPTKIGQLGLFREQGIYGLSVAIEQRQGVLTLVPTAARGSSGVVKDIQKGNLRDFRPVHLPQRVVVNADEVLGIREFGTESTLRSAQGLLLQKMAVARRDLDLTHEWQRMGAIKGQVLDADGTTVIYDWYTAWGMTQPVLSFALGVDTTRIRSKINTLERMVEDALGGMMSQGITVLASKEWFDAFTDHPSVTDTYKYTDGGPLRTNQRMTFEFAGLTIMEYRGTVGGTRFIAAGEAYAFPTGVPDLFMSYFAPAPHMDVVGQQGIPFYMLPEESDYKRSVAYDVQSNPLHVNTRPEAVVKLTL